MATTTNYSWTTPDDTALVKDGAAAIRSLGTAIDTTVFTNAGAAINKSIVDAAGDLIYGTADNTVARLAIGTASQQLRVNSGATAPEWFTPAPAGVTAVGAAVYGGTAQSCPNDTLVIVNFNNEYYDTDSMHSTSTNTSRITIPTGKGGIYLISGELAFTPGTANKLGVNIKKNGGGIAQFTQGAVGGDFDSQIPFAFTASLAANDYIELEARQLSGGTIDVKPNGSIFCVNYLGA